MNTKKAINVMWISFWLFFVLAGASVMLGVPKVPTMIVMMLCAFLGIAIHIKTSEMI